MAATAQNRMELIVTPKAGSKPLKAERRELFCHQYLLCKFIGSEAARAAGYSKKTARTQASKLLTQTDIRERIEYLKNQMAMRIMLKKDRMLRELSDIATVNIFDFLEIKEIERIIFRKDGTKEVLNVETVGLIEDLPHEMLGVIASVVPTQYGYTVKFHDKLKAHELIAKIKGWVNADLGGGSSDPEEFQSPEEVLGYLKNLPEPVKMDKQTKEASNDKG